MPKPKAQPHLEALRDRILRGAAAAFGRIGYAETRVEDIVAETGISRPTFYKVFDSKDAAFVALSERHHRAIRDRLEHAYASSSDPVLQLERATESFLRWRAELGPVGRVLDLDARSPGTRLANHRKRTLDYVIELTQAGLSKAGRPEADPALLRALVAASENVADELFTAFPVTEGVLQRAKAILLRIQGGALGGPGDPIPPLPMAPEKPKKKSRS